MNEKPILYRGMPLPLSNLSPDAFEDFIYQALVLLGPTKGFEMYSGRQPSGDRGFDCTARTKEDNHLISIQCKRYNSTLYTSTVAKEIIKVALENALHNSTVKQHYVITSGTVSEKLRRDLREDNYLSLKDECIKIIKGQKFQPALLKRANKKSLDPINVTKEYIDSLDKLIAWSGLDFQNEILVIWDALNNILDYHFALERVLVDQPTPNFNIAKYFKKIQAEKNPLVPLHYLPTSLPHNLENEIELSNHDEEILSINHLISKLQNNINIVLSSSGGSGKSCTLSLIEDELSSTQVDIEFIPVTIKLRSYSRNTLNQLINRELGIDYGSWKSLPFKFIFLFDGLDEMLQHDTQAFFDDLTPTIGHHNYVLTVRNTGLSIPTTAHSINACFSIQSLSYRIAFDLASNIFIGEELQDFYDEYRITLSMIGYNFLSSPFVLTLAIEYYKQHQSFPNTHEELLESWVTSKIKYDQARITSSNSKVNRIPIAEVENAYSLILYKSFFEKGINSLSEKLFTELVVECFAELKSSNSFITSLLNFYEFFTMIHQYEILSKDNEETYSTPHLIISEYLSAKTLAKNWRKYQNSKFDRTHYNIWLYCSNFIGDEEQEDFLSTVFNFDVQLATEIAKKFQENFIIQMQDKLLQLEQSEKVLTRSNAIFSLGILGTEACLERLKSSENLIDHHHSYQRLRSLTLNGDRETLLKIFKENEHKAQFPGTFSGGSYDLWFNAPPILTTNIARERLKSWKNDKDLPLCFSLRTIELFGDVFDIDILISVIKETDIEQEFYDASRALLTIDQKSLIELLHSLTNAQDKCSYWAKKCLLGLKEPINIDNEFDYFINYSKKEESELADDDIFYGLHFFVDFLEKNRLDDQKIDILIDTYRNLKFSSDFYYYNLIWRLALCGKSGSFLPIVDLAYEGNNPDEIHNAIGYLSESDELHNIDNTLSNKIDEYFTTLSDESLGTYFYYAKYYYKHKSKDLGLNLIRQKITETLATLSPDTVSESDYSHSMSNYWSFFHILSYQNITDEININEGDALKFLLIDTDHSNDQKRNTKLKILNKIDNSVLNHYAQQINNKAVRVKVKSYLLLNDLSNDPINTFAKYLQDFFSILSNTLR